MTTTAPHGPPRPALRLGRVARCLLLLGLIILGRSGPTGLSAAEWPEPHRVSTDELPAFAVRTGPNPTAARFFRERIQPVLDQHCASCHTRGKAKGGLHLDDLDGLLAGGADGPVVVPGDPERGLLMPSLRWQSGDEDLNMPPKGRLPDQVIDDFATWIRLGAPWPVRPPAAGPVTGADSVTAAGLVGATTSLAAGRVPDDRPPLLGRMHPVIVHFPIACLLLAVLAELLVWSVSQRARPAVWLLMAAGTAGALAAALTGSLLDPHAFGSVGDRHEVLGWATLVSAALSSALLLLTELTRLRRWLFLAALLLTAALVGLTGHLGGTLVYGKDWLF